MDAQSTLHRTNLGDWSPTLEERAGIVDRHDVFPNKLCRSAYLLQLYPLPNINGNPSYNFQIPVLNGSHQDSLQSRLDKTLGKRDQLYGNFNLQSIRADVVNLFSFVDTTDTLGFNANINWSHRMNQHLFLYAGYHFSRLRTLVIPEFQNKTTYPEKPASRAMIKLPRTGALRR